ncbi:Initiator Replication protein [Butyrivibrio fibrisolvens]|uniref:Initiator Replication protein n=1 Tax=Butyrivibrio fibrisolvens TaxID=831 RepID=A0A1H9UQ70_BUTFI|nr:replication initiation protein [Butyrivibrio fibrisolvens]SES11488.1 Initiator Replication protein [Butyrivibrio fibrisolvens]
MPNNIVKKGDNYKKSNFLITSKYKSSILENKILSIALANADDIHEESEGLVYEIAVSDLKRKMNISKSYGSFYDKLDDAAKSMTGRTIGTSNKKNRTFDYISVVTRATSKDGIFRIIFNPALKENIIDIKDKFTVLKLSTMLSFKSSYSLRLYELLKDELQEIKWQQDRDAITLGKKNTYRQENLFKYETSIGLAELKLEMGVVNAELDKVKRVLQGKNPDYEKAVASSPEQIFKSWSDFRRRVLEKATEEINEKTDLHVDFEADKAGRGGKVVGVTFIITDSKSYKNSNAGIKTKSSDVFMDDLGDPYIVEAEELDIDDLIDKVRMIISENLKTKEIKSILQAADNDISKIKDAYELAGKQSEIENLVGWMISAIKNGYTATPKKKNNTYSDFEQNTYDYELLEDELRAN